MRNDLWNDDLSRFVRRGCLDKTIDDPDLSIAWQPMQQTWLFAFHIAEQFKEKEPLRMLVEVWPNTGFVNFILFDNREFATLSLIFPELEKRWYEIGDLDETRFEAEYNQLVEFMLLQVEKSVPDHPTPNPGEVEITIRDTDDVDTERTRLLQF
ncbi:MAG: hypothetical protein R3C11_14625 [Planctomycetaceae bacterium]